MKRSERQRTNSQLAGPLDPDELVRTHYQPLFAYHRRLCGTEEDAKDLAQSTLIKAWNARASFRGDSTLTTWLHRIAYRVYVDWRRRHRPSAHFPETWWADCVDGARNPFERAREGDLAARVHAEVGQLEDPLRQVVHLHYYQGLKLKEVARVLAASPSTIKHRRRVALESLRRALAEETRHRPA